VWLRDPDKRALEELNRRAERFVSSLENLDARMELLSEVRRPEFARRIAAPIGAFLADAIAQEGGVAGLRTALEQGPRAFFAAYDRACQKDKSLIPLAKPIRDKLK
jgi:molybdopterin-guanine dinucleotide biosynthesis protein A